MAKLMQTEKRPRITVFKVSWGVFGGMPGRIRTPDLLIRSQTLYPAELRAHVQWPLATLTL